MAATSPEHQSDAPLAGWSQDQVLRLRDQLLALRLLQRGLSLPQHVAEVAAPHSDTTDDCELNQTPKRIRQLRERQESSRENALTTRKRELDALALVFKPGSSRWHRAHREKSGIALLSAQKELRNRILCNGPDLFNFPSPEQVTAMYKASSEPALQPASKWVRRRAGELKRRRDDVRGSFFNSLVTHASSFKQTSTQHETLRRLLVRDMTKYHNQKQRREREQERLRIQLLKSNDMEAYRRYVDQAKDARIKQLLEATDAYLLKLGAKVQERRAVEEPGVEETDKQEQVEIRKEDYQLQHRVVEKLTKQPAGLANDDPVYKLRSYQLEGVQWLLSLYNNNLNGILADEMGLGKTIQVVSLVQYLVHTKQVPGPYIVIVPLSTLPNWAREFGLWAPSLKVVTYRGPAAERKALFLNELKAGDFHVLLVQYELVNKPKDTARLGRLAWEYLIVDEGHRLKNKDCKLFHSLIERFTSKRKLLLTGTPLQNDVSELWALLNFLMPDIFDTHDDFEAWFNAPFAEKMEVGEEYRLLMISQLHQVLRPFMLRRVKAEVEDNLPDAKQVVIKTGLSALQKLLYARLQHKVMRKVDADGKVMTSSFNNLVMQLRKVCNHPFLFPEYEFGNSLTLIRCCGKFELLDKMLHKLRAANHRVLIYSQMVELLKLLVEFCEYRKYVYRLLDGSTKAEDRAMMMDEFNAVDSDIFVFLLSTRAGGQGINLQTADTVIIFDSDWNPMMDEQAKARVHRIGQRKQVLLARLVTPNTIEERILARADAKLRMDDLAIETGLFNLKSTDSESVKLLEEKLKTEMDDKMEREVHTDEQVNDLIARSEDEFQLFQQMDTGTYDAGEVEVEEGGEVERVCLLTEDEIPDWVTGVFDVGTTVRILGEEEGQQGGGLAVHADPVVGVITKVMDAGRFLIQVEGAPPRVARRSELAMGIARDVGEQDEQQGRRARRRVTSNEVVSHDTLTEREFELACAGDMDVSEIMERKRSRQERRERRDTTLVKKRRRYRLKTRDDEGGREVDATDGMDEEGDEGDESPQPGNTPPRFESP